MRFRTRAMLASTLLAAGLVALAPSASAQEGEEEHEFTTEEIEHIEEEAKEVIHAAGGTHADQECVAVLFEGNSPEECHESPSPIMPATDELLWGSISFCLLFLLMWKFALPAIKKGMNDRTERIRGDLEAAESAKTEQVSVLAQYQANLADARSEAARIIEEARQAADALKRDQEARLQTELAETRARATADIESAKVQAIADLKGDVAQLAVGAASAIVHKELDVATQTRLVEDYINQVSNS